MWFKFVAQSPQISIDLESEKFGDNMGHIHNLRLYKGNNLIHLTEDELPYNSESKKLSINLNAGELVQGEIYYIRVYRKAQFDKCDKISCLNNGCTDATQFKICVKELDIYLPNDFNNELPSISHGYELGRGQIVDLDGNVSNEVAMHTQFTNPQIYLGDQFTSMVWAKIDDDSTTVDTLHRVDMELQGSLKGRILKSEELNIRNNYYLGAQSNGILQNKSYARAVREDVYPEIDQHYFSNEEGFKMYFVVNPSGNHQDIKLKFTGGASVSLTPSGGLKVQTSLGIIEFDKPIVYNVNPGGNNVPMPASGYFLDLGNDEYGFFVQNYPSSRKLVIQLQKTPVAKGAGNTEWCTYLGGTGGDIVKDMDADENGNIYICGGTNSPTFPTVGAGIYQPNLDASKNGFISKFDPLYELTWSTFVGGAGFSNSSNDLKSIACDSTTQSLYVAGSSSNGHGVGSFPLAGSPTAFVETFGNVNNSRCYFARFNQNFGMREWMTMFPADNGGLEQKIDVDRNGNVYFAVHGKPSQAVTYTCSPTGDNTFPVCNVSSPNAYQQEPSSSGGPQEIYVGKFNSSLELVWSTALGGSESEFLYDIEVDDVTDHFYVVGATLSDPNLTLCQTANTSNLFPICSSGSAYLEDYRSDFDGFITRFSFDGELDWSTYYGGIGEDLVTDVEVDPQGNVIISGNSNSFMNAATSCSAPIGFDAGLPYCWPAGAYNQLHQPGYANDAFIAKFDVNNLNLIWGTRIGGPAQESESFKAPSPKLSVDSTGNIYLFGNTRSGSSDSGSDYQSSFPTLDHPDFYYSNGHADYGVGNLNAGHWDMFIMGYNNNGALFWSTYFGGTGSTVKEPDYAAEIVSTGEKVYICGFTNSTTSFPLNQPNTPTPYYQDQNLSTTFDMGFIAQVKLDQTVGIEEQSGEWENSDSDGIFVYPNPNNGEFELEWFSVANESVKLELVNQLGQIVRQDKIHSNTGFNHHHLTYGNLSNGIYFLNLRNDSNQQTVKLIIR
jgi:hypothetical protein